MGYHVDPSRLAKLSATWKDIPIHNNLPVYEVRNEDLLIESREEPEEADQAEMDDGPGVGDDDHEVLPSSRSSSESS